MGAAASKETLEFQTEVQQLLHLMIHSLYSNKDIFLRELISNASDAADKLRFEALADEGLLEGDSELRIRVDFDSDARTITIADNGIGMSRDEVVQNIGTIARSGTRHFLESLTGDQAQDAQLIGQFGVGFYSSFIVADRVTLTTRRAGAAAGEGVRWSSTGEGDYTLEAVEKPDRGTRVVLHLREGEDEYLDGNRLRGIIRKYSDHISIPIAMASGAEDAEQGVETVNRASALWARPRNEISEEEYAEFYKHVAHDFEAPLAHTHNRVEGKYEYTSLLYVPSRAPFDLWDREGRHGIKLYVRRVFIMDDAEHLMPQYLRFVRGVIDSADLPLNISREILQRNKVIDSIRAASVKKVLALLQDVSDKEPDKYAAFWAEFGKVLKEGPAEDFGNREQIAKLLRFASTRGDSGVQDVSLQDYVGRMEEGQEAIYYITADSYATARNSPHLEVFAKKGIEVLLMYDRVDEWLTGSLTEFDGKPLRSVARGDLELGELADDQGETEPADETVQLVDRIKQVLGDKVKDVRATQRLVRSPACLVVDEHDLSGNLQRLLKAAGQDVPATAPILEINPGHPLLEMLQGEGDEGRFEELTGIIYDQALLSEGGQLDDPADFVHRLNDLVLRMAGTK